MSNGARLRNLVEEGEDLLVLIRRQVLIGHGPARWHEEEHAPELCSGHLHQAGDFVQPVEVMARYGGVDLRIETDAPGLLQGVDGPCEGPGHTAETVVRVGVRAIQTDGHPRHTGLLEFLDGFRCQQRRGTGRDRGSQPY